MVVFPPISLSGTELVWSLPSHWKLSIHPPQKMHDSGLKNHSPSLFLSVSLSLSLSLSFHPLLTQEKHEHNFHPISLRNRWGVVVTAPQKIFFTSQGKLRHSPPAHNWTKTGPEIMLSNWGFYFRHKNIKKQELGRTQTRCTEADSLLWLLMLWGLGFVQLEQIESLCTRVYVTCWMAWPTSLQW